MSWAEAGVAGVAGPNVDVADAGVCGSLPRGGPPLGVTQRCSSGSQPVNSGGIGRSIVLSAIRGFVGVPLLSQTSTRLPSCLVMPMHSKNRDL